MVGIPRSEPCRPQEHTGRCLVGEPRKRLPPPPGTCARGPKLFGDQVKTRGGFKACRVISPGNQRLRPPPPRMRGQTSARAGGGAFPWATVWDVCP